MLWKIRLRLQVMQNLTLTELNYERNYSIWIKYGARIILGSHMHWYKVANNMASIQFSLSFSTFVPQGCWSHLQQLIFQGYIFSHSKERRPNEKTCALIWLDKVPALSHISHPGQSTGLDVPEVLRSPWKGLDSPMKQGSFNKQNRILCSPSISFHQVVSAPLVNHCLHRHPVG